MHVLTGETISYKVEPDFPFVCFGNFDVWLCPDCGGKTVFKIEEMQPRGDYLLQVFCEKCNEWVMHCSVSRMALDDTIYRLEFSRKEIDDKIDSGVKSELLDELDNLSDIKEQGDEIIILGKAEMMYDILQKLIAINAAYDITPPFIHKIEKYREFDEELIREILELNKRYN